MFSIDPHTKINYNFKKRHPDMIDPFCLLCKTISFDASRQHPVFNIAFNPSVSPTVICVDRTFPLLNLSEEKKN